mmetsp:Transcript_5392/g.16008  ORF Transcript_5392/g.16008 Transcript_5392/m.16008 type:complete len:745 (+) Transcript_5392:82-2316(+)
MAGVDIVALGLSSQPERWAAFRDENQEALRAWVAAGCGCGRLEAVDGAELRSQSPESLRRLEREGLVDLAEPAVSAMTWGALGTASSHQRLWQRAAASSRPLLILEDEVRLAPGAAAELENALRSLPADGWDILYLGWDLDSEVTLAHPGMPHGSLNFSVRCSRDGKDLARPPSDGPCGGRALLQASHVRGLCAYAVSPRGARALLMRCFPLQGDLDEAVCQGLDQFRGFACFPPLASLPHRGAPAASVAAAADAAAGAPKGGREAGGLTPEVARRSLVGQLAQAQAQAQRQVQLLPLAAPEGGDEKELGRAGGEEQEEEAEEDDDPEPTWQVVGGQGFGGIIVREGADLESRLLGRLQWNAVIMQKERDVCRIRFEKLLGEGPTHGWVSIASKGKDILQRMKTQKAHGSGRGLVASAEAAPALTRNGEAAGAGAEELKARGSREGQLREEWARKRKEEVRMREQQKRELEERARILAEEDAAGRGGQRRPEDVADFQQWLSSQERGAMSARRSAPVDFARRESSTGQVALCPACSRGVRPASDSPFCRECGGTGQLLELAGGLPREGRRWSAAPGGADGATSPGAVRGMSARPSPAAAAERAGLGAKEQQDEDVVELWASGDCEKAWWHEASPAGPIDEEQLREWMTDVEGSDPRERASTQVFNFQDNDPEEVEDLSPSGLAGDAQVDGGLPDPTKMSDFEPPYRFGGGDGGDQISNVDEAELPKAMLGGDTDRIGRLEVQCS